MSEFGKLINDQLVIANRVDYKKDGVTYKIATDDMLREDGWKLIFDPEWPTMEDGDEWYNKTIGPWYYNEEEDIITRILIIDELVGVSPELEEKVRGYAGDRLKDLRFNLNMEKDEDFFIKLSLGNADAIRYRDAYTAINTLTSGRLEGEGLSKSIYKSYCEQIDSIIEGG